MAVGVVVALVGAYAAPIETGTRRSGVPKGWRGRVRMSMGMAMLAVAVRQWRLWESI